MRRSLILLLAISVLFICGCSSSGSGGSSAPDANYSGTYRIVDYSQAYGEALGDITIVQDGGNAALTYDGYAYDITETATGGTITTAIELNDLLTGTAIGEVHGREIDATWATGAFTKLEFTTDGSAFSASGDVSFGGYKQS